MESVGSTRVQTPRCFVAGIYRGNTFKMIDETSFFHKKHHFFFIRAVNSLEEEEMEKQIDDGTFDECAYVKDDDDLCA